MNVEALRTSSRFACPACSGRHSKTIDSRPNDKGIVRRRHECRDCGARFTTQEAIVGAPSDRTTCQNCIELSRRVRTALGALQGSAPAGRPQR